MRSWEDDLCLQFQLPGKLRQEIAWAQEFKVSQGNTVSEITLHQKEWGSQMFITGANKDVEKKELL
jgi:hypothetical protein